MRYKNINQHNIIEYTLYTYIDAPRIY